MGMHLSIYVGPYYTVPKDFNHWDWDGIVSDGRCEAGHSDDCKILIPNIQLEGISRQFAFDAQCESPIVQVSPATIVKETAAFGRVATPLIKWCDENGVEIREGWGVVPCWC